MIEAISIVESGKTFSPYYFYNTFLKKVAKFYKKNTDRKDVIEFSLVIEEDASISNNYFIDPIILPLLISLSEQLRKYHNHSIELHLSNNKRTNDLLAFLYRSDFFHLVGNNINPTYPKGRNIFSFDERYLGDFNKLQKPEHKLRGYSLKDDSLEEKIDSFEQAEDKRDFLIEYYLYKVKEHFGVLLNSNLFTEKLSFEFVDILAELITNGVLHSESDAYVLMYTDNFKSKFSISDNGKGLYKSLEEKSVDNIVYYKKFEIFKELKKLNNLKINEQIENSLLAIFEILYYSMLKDRHGLFDLMCNVVLFCNGYFRLHNENAQIIVSARMLSELKTLYDKRQQIIQIHDNYLFETISKQEFEIDIQKIAISTKEDFIQLATSIFDKYHLDTRYSSIRLFEVKFKGVHIEVEIPNLK